MGRTESITGLLDSLDFFGPFWCDRAAPHHPPLPLFIRNHPTVENSG